MAANVKANEPKPRFSFPMTRNLWGFAKSFITPVPKEWVDPPDLDKVLDEDGFISPKYWEPDHVQKYPAVVQDLDTLKEFLLPLFLSYSQRAKYYQNSYYFYQRIFIIGAFLTTVLAIFTTFFSKTDSGLTGPVFGTTFQSEHMLELFSVLTTIVSAITGYFTILSQKGEPRKRWSNYRRLAEELRMTYFKFLAHQAPYDKPNRLDNLRQNVYEVRQKGRGINA
jgi:hypothetical protein